MPALKHVIALTKARMPELKHVIALTKARMPELKHGLMVHQASGDEMTTTFVGSLGRPIYSHTITRKRNVGYEREHQ